MKTSTKHPLLITALRLLVGIGLLLGAIMGFVAVGFMIHEIYRPGNFAHRNSPITLPQVLWIVFYVTISSYYMRYAWKLARGKTTNLRPAIIINALQLVNYAISGVMYRVVFGLSASLKIVDFRYQTIRFPDRSSLPHIEYATSMKPIAVQLRTMIIPYINLGGGSGGDDCYITVNLFALAFLIISIYLPVYFKRQKKLLGKN